MGVLKRESLSGALSTERHGDDNGDNGDNDDNDDNGGQVPRADGAAVRGDEDGLVDVGDGVVDGVVSPVEQS